MGLIQNCLLFLIVYSFTSNSQGKLVKIDLKVSPSIIITPKIKTTELAALPFPKKGELRPPPELSTPNNKGLSFIRK